VSMDTLRVGRLRARYRLPSGQPEGRARLDRALRRMLDEVMEPALAAAGIPAREEVCIRALSVPARLRLAEGDDALATAWGTTLAAAVRAALDAGGTGIVRYSSLSHALTDVASAVSAGDLSRAWAWRQLGLWSAADSLAPEAAASEAVAALRAHPALVVAVLSRAARSGALARLAPRLSAVQWTALARAALEAAGVPDGPAATLLAPRPTQAPSVGSADGASAAGDGDRAGEGAGRLAVDGQAAAVVRASWIASAAARFAASRAEVRRAVAVLAVLEVEPAAIAEEPARGAELVQRVERAATAAARPADGPLSTDVPGSRIQSTTEDLSSPADTRAGPGSLDAAGASPGAAGPATTETGAPSTDQPARTAAGAVDALDAGAPRGAIGGGDAPNAGSAAAANRLPVQSHAPESDPGEGRTAVAAAAPDGGRAEPAVGTAVVDAAPEGESAPEDVRSTGDTRWGGLLFLLHLIPELEIPAAALAAPLDALPLRWVLHALAGALLALDPRDPAGLAFAGLPPESDPPSDGGPPATDEEAAAMDALAARLQVALHRRLHGAAPADGRAAHALLRQVCRRTATVEADPGWFDVRLAFDEVSVGVRRAGLDLDPGWLPWLGVAVRFVYV
jgi:hypothetical protein